MSLDLVTYLILVFNRLDNKPIKTHERYTTFKKKENSDRPSPGRAPCNVKKSKIGNGKKRMKRARDGSFIIGFPGRVRHRQC